jgi:endonuclease/exonuclease/phosphatase family metal-dependent hydrolase
VFTTHLQSNQFEYKDYDVLHKISKVDDSVYSASRSVVKKLRSAYRNREDQADMVRIQLDNSPLPEIITGDFNDVPNSYAYFRIRGDRQDAFAKKGWGIGRTFSHISPTLRIDYIMADKQFKVLRYERKILNCSDHYPLVADLQLPSK